MPGGTPPGATPIRRLSHVLPVDGSPADRRRAGGESGSRSEDATGQDRGIQGWAAARVRRPPPGGVQALRGFGGGGPEHLPVRPGRPGHPGRERGRNGQEGVRTGEAGRPDLRAAGPLPEPEGTGGEPAGNPAEGRAVAEGPIRDVLV